MRYGFLVLVVVAGVGVYLTRGSETPQSYCHVIYRDGGSTPSWAAHSFNSYATCVRWYVDMER